MNDLFSASVNIFYLPSFSLSSLRILIWSLKLDSFYPPLYHQKGMKEKKKHEKKMLLQKFSFSLACVVVVKWLSLSGKIFIFALIFKRIFESPSTLYGRKSILKFFFSLFFNFIFSHLLFFYFISASLSFFCKKKIFHTFCFRINFLFGVFFSDVEEKFFCYTIC